jgi:hypothetical protein
LLGVPETLNKYLLDMNIRENPFRNVRTKIGQVKNGVSKRIKHQDEWGRHYSNWCRKRFRQIREYKDIPL